MAEAKDSDIYNDRMFGAGLEGREYGQRPGRKDNSDREPRGRAARQAEAAASNPAAPAPAAPAPSAAPAGPVAPKQASAYNALPQMQGYDAYTQAAMGASPAEAMKLAQAAAAQTAQTQADQAVAQAVKGARTAGAMPGQAALGATGQAANAYGQGLQAGQQQYFDLTKLGASLGSEMSGRLSRAEQTQAGIDAAKMQAAAARAQQRQQMFGNIIGAVGGIASLFSDERLKEDIEPDPLTEGLEKIRGYSYKYKGNPREEAGIMAQDLEETNMAPAVMDTPEGKMIDTRRLTTMNTAALADQEGRLKAIEKLLEGIRGIPAPKKAEV